MIRAASLVDPVGDGVVSHSSGLEPPSKKKAELRHVSQMICQMMIRLGKN